MIITGTGRYYCNNSPVFRMSIREKCGCGSDLDPIRINLENISVYRSRFETLGNQIPKAFLKA
jgi:hypothetical protein